MTFEFTPDLIINSITSTIFLITAIFCFKDAKNKNILPLTIMGFICVNYFLLFFGLGFDSFISSIDAARINAFLFYPSIILMILLINYTHNEKLYSNFLIPFFCFGLIYCIIIFNPNVIIAEKVVMLGFINIFWKDWFFWFISSLHTAYLILTMYWVLKNYVHSPFEIKKYSEIYLVGNVIAVIIGFIFFLFSLWVDLFLYIALILFAVGESISFFAIMKEPKILYVLPFTLYQMKIKNKKGTLIFRHQWMKQDFPESDPLIKSYKNTHENNQTEDYIEISVVDGKIMVYQLKSCMIEMYASKTSKLLNQLVKLFSKDFEREFQRELEESNDDLTVYEPAYKLINEYFSNIPSRLIKHKDQSLLFSPDHVEIPPELDKILKELIQDEEEYNRIKCDYQRSPKSISEEFLKLYKELKDQTE
ncbi:MAG: hypothetical protein EAX96_17800 [Candidatus Lokiarchaeota archaeon]|nr:hypothetical protein [Candidatus Lokiarchaeota archaeon]